MAWLQVVQWSMTVVVGTWICMSIGIMSTIFVVNLLNVLTDLWVPISCLSSDTVELRPALKYSRTIIWLLKGRIYLPKYPRRLFCLSRRHTHAIIACTNVSFIVVAFVSVLGKHLPVRLQFGVWVGSITRVRRHESIRLTKWSTL